ncbi:MAG: hypothetical protein ACTSSJ_00785 [Candidatus Odinarchaeia archaeon]
MSEESVPLYPLRKKIKHLPPAFKGAIEEVFREAMNRALPEYFEEERDTLDLGEVKTAWRNEKARQQIEELIKELNLDKKLGFDWEKRKFKV